jgi:hypothetical protein
VPEDCNLGIGHTLLEHAGKKRKMIILYQNDWIFLIGNLFGYRIGKTSVYLVVKLPIGCSEGGTGMGHMA